MSKKKRKKVEVPVPVSELEQALVPAYRNYDYHVISELNTAARATLSDEIIAVANIRAARRAVQALRVLANYEDPEVVEQMTALLDELTSSKWVVRKWLLDGEVPQTSFAGSQD